MVKRCEGCGAMNAESPCKWCRRAKHKSKKKGDSA